MSGPTSSSAVSESDSHIPDASLPPAILVLGMAGSGKTSFVQRLTAFLHARKTPPYVINLDPAVRKIPYPANIDIRDTVKYKEVMKEYGLGPNGAIMTCLNLLCTRFDQVLNLLRMRSSSYSCCLIDTPGQIEAFTWSASGSIITDSLASAQPTVVIYVVDTARASNPTTFMSNMLYACSILYRTKLPFMIVFNKADIVKPTFAKKWMTDFEEFHDALEENRASYTNDLSRSLSLVLDEFYSDLKTVSVSAATGEGMAEVMEAIGVCVKQYKDDYLPMYEKVREEKRKIDEEEKKRKIEEFRKETAVLSVNADINEIPIGKIHLGGVNEENDEDAHTMRL